MIDIHSKNVFPLEYITDRKIGPSFLHGCVKSAGHLRDGLFQFDLFQDIPESLIRVLVKRIQIPSKTSDEEDRLLGNDGYVLSQFLQGNRRGVDVVDEDGAGAGDGQTEEGTQQGRLAGTCSTDYSYLKIVSFF